MAEAVLERFPDAKLGIGPAIADGFYYDFELPRPLTPEDLPVIIEIVDSKDNLENFLRSVDDVIASGLATLEKADVRFYRHK